MKLSFPESERWACDGELLTRDEVTELIAKLTHAMRGGKTYQ